MIPLILADPATGTGKPAPQADASADNAEGESFGDLMTDAETVADEDAPTLPDMRDIVSPEEDVELALASPLPKPTEAEVDVKVAAPPTADFPKITRAIPATTDALSDGKQVDVGVRATAQSRDAETVVEPKLPAPAKGDLPGAPSIEVKTQRPSVAQSVVEGKLPQAQVSDSLQTNPTPDQPRPKVDIEQAPTRTVPSVGDSAKPVLLVKDSVAKVSIAVPIDENPRVRREEPVAPPVASVVSKPATSPLAAGPPPAVALAQAGAQLVRDASDKVVSTHLSDVIVTTSQIERQTVITTMPAGSATTASPEAARQVATQIAVAVSNTPGKTTEIALNPEELGRVRLSLSAAEGAITLNVLAERPETQDLLRRHMDLLAQEFRQLGYTSISFSFGDQKRETQSGSETAQEATDLDVEEAVETSLIPAEPQASGLDLRV